MSQCTVDDVLESIDQWTILDVNKLVKGIETKYGISAAPVAGAAIGGSAAPAAAGGAAAVEKTEFSVVLTNGGANKIPVIKVVRELTGLSLKDAKDLVEGAPKSVKDGVAKEAAEDMKKKLVEAGATVEIK